MDVYSKYVAWCGSIGVTPAARETYEKTVQMIDESPKCSVCNRKPVSVFGEACNRCVARGQAAKPE